MSNTISIIKKFINQKNSKHPISGEPLSKNKRMESMFTICVNNEYGTNYTREDRIMAAEFIKEIIKEDN